MTSKELAEQWQCGTQTAMARLHRMVEAGKVRCVKVQRQQIDGAIRRTTAYELVE